MLVMERRLSFEMTSQNGPRDVTFYAAFARDEMDAAIAGSAVMAVVGYLIFRSRELARVIV